MAKHTMLKTHDLKHVFNARMFFNLIDSVSLSQKTCLLLTGELNRLQSSFNDAAVHFQNVLLDIIAWMLFPGAENL